MAKTLLSRSEFARNVLTLFTGTAFSQIVPIILAPLLTRLYTPVDFGLLTIYVSIAGLISIVSTGRYELAIMLPKEDKDAVGIVALSLSLVATVSLLCLIGIWTFQTEISIWYNEPHIKPWLMLVPLTVLLTGISQVLNYWLTRQKRFKHLSGVKIADSTVNNLVKVGLGFRSMGVGGLISGNIAGQCVYILTAGWAVMRREFLAALIGSASSIKYNAKKYSDFLRINTLHALSDVAQFAIIVFLIANFFGTEIAGLFGFTYRILKTPLGFIGAAVGQVFFQKAAEKKAAGEDLRSLVGSIATTMAMLFTPVLIVLFFFGEDVFSIVFGIEWTLAGKFATIMSPWLFMNFIVSPLSVLPIVLEKQKHFFLISLLSHICAIFAIIVGHYVFNDFESGLMLFSGCLTFFSIVLITWFLQATNKR